nr:hypothetical protein CFP56_29645 [Quercus suber]
MVDFTFDIEIHVGGCFVEEPTIKYVGGSVRLLTEIDHDKLSFFEIRDLCHLVGAPKEHSIYKYLLPESDLQDDLRDIETDANVLNMTTLHRAWPVEKIIIYTEINVEPLAVEYPDRGGVADDGSIGGNGLEGVADGVGGDVDGDVSGLGLEGDDFGDDIFAAQNSAPQGSAPNTASKSSNAFHADPEWAKPAFEDDLPSHANRSTGGVRTRGQLAAQRPPK